VTLYEAAARARAQLIDVGLAPETAQRDAELLARHAAGWDLASWLARRGEPADAQVLARFATLIERRLAREPIAYIRGVQEFWGREFRVSPAVLIPRPETELLVEAALAFLTARPRAIVVDVGTGSGCIAITLALEAPHAWIYAVDISADALALARRNAATLGASGICFLEGRYLASSPRPVDLIVSNPPYVAQRDAPALPPEVRDYEPHVALFGGDDGWRDIRILLAEASAALAPGGRLLMEIGYGQVDTIHQEVERAASDLVLRDTLADLQGIPRVAVIHRR
jgi:release factor glutamine methyltransferase